MATDLLLEQITSKIKTGISSCNIDFYKIKKLLVNFKKNEVIESLLDLREKFKFFNNFQKFNRFGNLFLIVKNYVKKLELEKDKQNNILLFLYGFL